MTIKKKSNNKNNSRNRFTSITLRVRSIHVHHSIAIKKQL